MTPLSQATEDQVAEWASNRELPSQTHDLQVSSWRRHVNKFAFNSTVRKRELTKYQTEGQHPTCWCKCQNHSEGTKNSFFYSHPKKHQIHNADVMERHDNHLSPLQTLLPTVFHCCSTLCSFLTQQALSPAAKNILHSHLKFLLMLYEPEAAYYSKRGRGDYSWEQ